MGGLVGRVGHAHMSYYARARVIPDHLVCPIDYPSMPLSISHSMPGFCWRDIGHKALCPISYGLIASYDGFIDDWLYQSNSKGYEGLVYRYALSTGTSTH